MQSPITVATDKSRGRFWRWAFLPLAVAAALAVMVVSLFTLGGAEPAQALAPTSDKDINALIAAGNTNPQGIWSDGTTMWVADDSHNLVFAYNLATGQRDGPREFRLDPAGNWVRGIWSNGTIMWWADDYANKIYAYNMVTKQRVPDREFNDLADAGNTKPVGIWSNGFTMWVVDDEDRKIYAYGMFTGGRVPALDFNTLAAAGNNGPVGIWSDGITMWVADDLTDKIYAYSMATKQRDAAKDLAGVGETGNTNPSFIWSDKSVAGIGGRAGADIPTMWVVDNEDDKIYAYRTILPAGTLVGNLHSDVAGELGVHYTAFAQGFRTGPPTGGGYLITSLDLPISGNLAKPENRVARVRILTQTPNGNTPGTVIAEVGHQAAHGSSGVLLGNILFTRSPLVLEPDTTYFLYVDCVVREQTYPCVAITTTGFNGESVRTRSGWSIQDHRLASSGSSWNTNTHALRFRLNGRAAPVQGLVAHPDLRHVTLQWAAFHEATSYTVWWRKTNEGFSGDRRKSNVTNLSVTIDGLEPSTEYTFRVVPVIGNTPAPDGYSDVTRATNAPGAITGLTAVPGAPNTLDVSWNAHPRATSYAVSWKRESGAESDFTTTSTTGPSINLTGLTGNVRYTVRVQAHDNVGAISGAVAETSGVPAARPPAPPKPKVERPASSYQYLADECGTTRLAVDGRVNGRWDDDDCISSLSYRHESKFYWFEVGEGQSEVALTLQGGGRDAALWVWPEWTSNLYHAGGVTDMNARWLLPGRYFLEVDSGTSASNGKFKLDIEGLGAGPDGLSCADTSWTFTGSASVQGRWDAGCTNVQHRREYSLQLTETKVVTIDVTSPDADPVLTLTEANSNRVLDSNDDYSGSNRRSRITRTLPAGLYYIDVNSKVTGQTGSFTLTLTLDDLVSCADTYTTITRDAAIGGQWKPGCEYSGGHERYHDLVVANRGQVTLTLDSAAADPVLRLSGIAYSGGAASFTLLESNDDFEGSTSRSRITRTLDPGRYRIEARAKNAGETGAFTLTVAGLGAGSALSCADTYRSFTAEHTLTGRWGPGCEQPRTPDQQPSFQRYYDLELDWREKLTLVLTSDDADPSLSLHRIGDDGSHTPVASNDDDNGSTSRSRITRNLEAGTYRITAAPKNPVATGEFTLSVVEGTTIYRQWDSADDVLRRPVNISGSVSITINSTGGYSTDLHFDQLDGTTKSSVRYVTSPNRSLRSDRDASLTVTGVPSGSHTIRARLSPYQSNELGNMVRIVDPLIWSATMTVGGLTVGDLGYTSAGGSLAPNTFSHGGVDFTVSKLFHDVSLNSLTTNFSRTGIPTYASAYALCLDGELIYTSSGANVFGLNGIDTNRLLSTTLSWSLGDQVSVKVYEGSSCTPPELLPIKYPVHFSLNYKNVNHAVSALTGGLSDSPPRVSDQSQFKTHNATVGQAFSIVLPAADAGSGNGGPYQYILWKRGAGVQFAENGLSFNAQTRELSGTPAAEGTHLLAYQVHDGDGNRARSDSFVEETYLQIVVAAVGVTGDTGPQQTEPRGTNRAPAFDANVVTALSVPENSPAGTSVGAPITATDQDGDTLTYSLSGDDAASFAIDNAGQITTVAGVTYDYEVESYRFEPWYSLTVTADDGRRQSASIDVTVSLTDVDDAPAENLPPAFHEGDSTTRSVAENSPAGTKVGNPVTAYDLNGDKLTYLALDGADGASFALDPDTGQLTTIAGVTYDYDTKSSYDNIAVVVMELDTEEGYLSAISVTVNLTKVEETPDTAPTVTETVNSRKLKTHYATVDQAFSLVLPAADADSGNGGPYEYTLLNRADDTAFGSNGLSFASATRTLSGTPLAEKTHELTYRVHDGDDNRADTDAFIDKANLKIVVAPSGKATGGSEPPNPEPANQAPAFDAASATRSVAENSAAGTNVGAAVTATDPDAGDTLTYTLSGTDAASFAIGGSTGQITTVDGESYDYEVKSSYSLKVEATDGKGGTASIAVTVNLINVNEAPAFGEGEADETGVKTTTRQVAENSPAGTSVGAPIDATDPDGDTLTYSLTGTDATSFTIGSATGQITTITGETYDHEAKASYDLVVAVTDTGGLLSAIGVTVSLTDVEETANGQGNTGPQQTKPGPPRNRAPAFADTSATREVAENSAAGTNVGPAITATDPDTGDTLTYSLSGTDAASFTIDASTGQITTVANVNYDYESKSSYSLTVDASDAGGLSASIAVTVNLTNVNEAPAFAPTSATREVAENSAAGVNVGVAVVATDPDDDSLTYSLSGTDASSFTIGASTGQITTVANVDYDYESKSSYSLTVNAADEDGLSDSIAVTVTLTDVGTPVTACFTDLGTLSATAEYAGKWDAADCKAHHQDSRGRYFQFTLSAATEVSISLTAGTLYVSAGGDPNNGWGTAPKGTYEHRRNVRSANGKLVHSGGRTATLTLAAGEAYTMEAAGASGDFTITIAPQ